MRSVRYLAFVLVLSACGGQYGDDNIAACDAFEASCDGIVAARDGLYANCTVWGTADAEENCDYQPFFDCVSAQAVCDASVPSEDVDGDSSLDGAPWLVAAFAACDDQLPATCEGALYVQGSFAE